MYSDWKPGLVSWMLLQCSSIIKRKEFSLFHICLECEFFQAEANQGIAKGVFCVGNISMWLMRTVCQWWSGFCFLLGFVWRQRSFSKDVEIRRQGKLDTQEERTEAIVREADIPLRQWDRRLEEMVRKGRRYGRDYVLVGYIWKRLVELFWCNLARGMVPEMNDSNGWEGLDFCQWWVCLNEIWEVGEWGACHKSFNQRFIRSNGRKGWVGG